MTYLPIEQYGVIGDLHTAALVGRNGSIDWLCLPRFDSPSIFGAIVDDRIGGRFQIRAGHDQAATRQLYVPETNVLITRFLDADGVGEVYDCMPVEADEPGTTALVHDLVRVVHAVRGSVAFELECRPGFDYARAGHTVQAVPDGCIFTSDQPEPVRFALLGSVPLELRDGTARARFTLSEGEWAAFVLEHVDDDDPNVRLPSIGAAREAVQQTVDFWQRWLSRCTYRGRWREVVHRSALTLKMLTYAPTGAIVAAPTTSLPEAVGGVRNWDYRYTWIRDASFTVYALMRIGFVQEAARFIDWLTDRCHEIDPSGPGAALQIMYGIDGRNQLDEMELSHLEGYRSSRPVRVGNNAYGQLQLDIYGELLDSVYLYDKYGSPIGYDLWKQLVRLLDWLAQNWQQPDEGIWEVRGGRQHFVFSKMMCWVAFDRALRMATKRGLPAPRGLWQDTLSEIYEQVMERGWDERQQSFVQRYGSEYLDAGNLLMPLVKFVAPTDPRMLGTLARTRQTLVSDSLVYRYAPAGAAIDGLLGDEGTFSLCSFWWVEALTRAGELREARLTFEKMLTYANHLGLYGEQLGTSAESLGNFPQAFTHLALISAAYNLNAALDRPHLASAELGAPLLGPS
ncbi:MAG TPA: glycoside hydrolase family 15 protein [Chloroflexota bacterium]|nr:glycoside hydrolase family 15 protein [Chloroflexota bacterium]